MGGHSLVDEIIYVTCEWMTLILLTTAIPKSPIPFPSFDLCSLRPTSTPPGTSSLPSRRLLRPDNCPVLSILRRILTPRVEKCISPSPNWPNWLIRREIRCSKCPFQVLSPFSGVAATKRKKFATGLPRREFSWPKTLLTWH